MQKIVRIHCLETATPFVSFWYLLGLSIATLFGRLIEPHVLCWYVSEP
ncbi:MAG: DUF1109 domain-containing protein [Burkholderiaceae bacterium]|nr:DUF1109 domain-containing protein [Burkholderiaceae bacterium]